MPATPTTEADPRLLRALAFERAMHASVGRVVTTSWGQVFVDTALGLCYERNAAWAVGDAGGLDAVALDRDVERLFSAAGLGHRRLVVGPPASVRVDVGLAQLGYGLARHRYSAFAGQSPAPPRAPVDEVGIEAVVAANERYLATDPGTTFARSATLREQLCEHHRTYGSGAPVRERCFAVLDAGGAVAAWALLWSGDGVAQVEDVVCLAEHRGHGYGRDVVAAATRAALAAEPELLFIIADEDDWPKALYERIGYAPVGWVSVHTRHAPGHWWGAPVASPDAAPAA